MTFSSLSLSFSFFPDIFHCLQFYSATPFDQTEMMFSDILLLLCSYVPWIVM